MNLCANHKICGGYHLSFVDDNSSTTSRSPEPPGLGHSPLPGAAPPPMPPMPLLPSPLYSPHPHPLLTLYSPHPQYGDTTHTFVERGGWTGTNFLPGYKLITTTDPITSLLYVSHVLPVLLCGLVHVQVYSPKIVDIMYVTCMNYCLLTRGGHLSCEAV